MHSRRTVGKREGGPVLDSQPKIRTGKKTTDSDRLTLLRDHSVVCLCLCEGMVLDMMLLQLRSMTWWPVEVASLCASLQVPPVVASAVGRIRRLLA